MDLRPEIQHFHGEHQDILRFLKDWEEALTQATSEDEALRCTGLTRLRQMEPKLLAIQEHCRQEEQSVDSAFRLYLDSQTFEQLQAEHDLLDQFAEAYLDELRYITTPPPAERLIGLGRRLVHQLHEHIRSEEQMLERIGECAEAEEKVLLRYTQSAE